MFESLFDALPWPAMVFDDHGQFLAVNALASAEAAGGRDHPATLADLLARQRWSLTPAECLSVRSRPLVHREFCSDADGTHRVVTVRASRFEHDLQSRLLVAWEAAPQASDAVHRDRMVFQHNPEAIFLTHLDGRIAEANPAACRLLGMTEEEIRGVGRHGILQQDEALTRALQRRGTTNRGDLTYVRRDGTCFVGDTLSVVVGERGDPSAALIMVRDVTEERLTADRLRELTNRLQLATTAAKAGVWDWRLTTNEMHWDDRMLELYGFTRESFPGGVEAWKQRLHPDDFHRAIEESEAALRGEREYDTQFRVLRPDGTTVHIKANGLVLRDEQGAPVRMIGLNTDVTEHRVVERAAAERAEELSRFFDLASDLLCIIAPDTTLRRVSQEWTAALGWSPEELVGHSFVDFLHPDDIEPSLAAVRRLSDRQPIRRFTNRYRCRDGSYRWLEWRAVAPAGDVVYGVARDVTERQLQEEELRQSEQRFQGLVEAASEPIFVQLDGRFAYLNAAAVTLFGASSAEALIGTPVIDCFHSSSREGVLERIRRLNVDREPAGSPVEVIGVRPDGSQFSIETAGSPVMYQGQPGAVVFARDVTERKRLEAQLAQSQRMEAIGRLAGGIAHDFNNMLTVIIGSAEMLLSGCSPGDPTSEALSDILTAARQSAGLTRQLLAFARKQTIRPRIVNLNEVLPETLKMLRRLVGEDVVVSCQPGESIWPVYIDPGQVDQILTNLVVNARDAMPDGGRIHLDTNNVRLDEGAAPSLLGAPPGEYVFLAVSDTGSGMSDEVRRRVFEPFFTTKAPGAGTGLGLATVYGIVKQHGGYIDVESEVSRGTTFKIWFPRHVVQAQSVVAAPEEATPQGVETVLLVEDEAGILKLTSQMLTLLGYKLLAASDGATALALADDYGDAIDLVLTDVIMPGMNGRELVSRLEATRPGIKSLYLSGYTADVIAHHGVLEAGVELLEKPFSFPRLAQTVRRVLDQ